MMFAVGNIVVSTAVASSYRTKGSIHMVYDVQCNSVYKNYIKYNTLIGCKKNGNADKFRLATAEEKEAYNNGIRHIKDIKPSISKNYLKKDTYVVILKRIDKIAIKGGILKIIKNPNKSCIFLEKYGPCAKNRLRDGQVKWFETYKEAEEFSNKLLNKQLKTDKNGKEKNIINKESGKVRKGTARSSVSSRQIATASRLVGNSKTARSQKTRIGKCKISFSARSRESS